MKATRVIPYLIFLKSDTFLILYNKLQFLVESVRENGGSLCSTPKLKC